MNLCKPEEAQKYKCCSMDKMCEGSDCMAWKKHYVADENLPPISRDMCAPALPQLKDSGMGFCGLVRTY